MTVTTVYADNSGTESVGYTVQIDTNTSSYAVAREQRPAFAIGTGQVLSVGQDFNGGSPRIWQSYLRFNTAAVPDIETVTDVQLSLGLQYDGSATDFIVQARLFDYGATLEVGDVRKGSELAALTLLATLPTAGIGGTLSYKLFTKTDAFKQAINKTGYTSFMLCSDRNVSGTAPTQGESVNFYEEGFNFTYRPKLVITSLFIPQSGFPKSFW